MSLVRKNIIAVICMLALFCIFAITPNAQANTINTTAVYGLSTTPPSKNPLSTQSTDYPTNVKDLSIGGQYSFKAGVHYGSLMYTNYRFKGKNSYTVTVYNTGNAEINVRVFKVTRWSVTDETIKSLNLAPKHSTTFNVGGLSKNDEIYLGFNNYAGSYIIFNGVIR